MLNRGLLAGSDRHISSPSLYSIRPFSGTACPTVYSNPFHSVVDVTPLFLAGVSQVSFNRWAAGFVLPHLMSLSRSAGGSTPPGSRLVLPVGYFC